MRLVRSKSEGTIVAYSSTAESRRTLGTLEGTTTRRSSLSDLLKHIRLKVSELIHWLAPDA